MDICSIKGCHKKAVRECKTCMKKLCGEEVVMSYGYFHYRDPGCWCVQHEYLRKESKLIEPKAQSTIPGPRKNRRG